MDNEATAMITRVKALDAKTGRLTSALEKLGDISLIKAIELGEEFDNKNMVLLEAYNNGAFEIMDFIDRTSELYSKFIKKTNKAIKNLTK